MKLEKLVGDRFREKPADCVIDSHGRLAASICEAHHDEYGPIWPMSVAPWQVHICAVRADDINVKEYADKLYAELQSKGIEVIYDDRAVSAGVMFSDADLLGIPLRIIVSPRNMKESCCEIVSRDKKISLKIPLDLAQAKVSELVSLFAIMNPPL